MNRRRIAAFVAAAMLIVVLAPLSESVVLAAQKKKSCGCKPTLRRKTRTTRVQRANVAASRDVAANAAVVGPVYATYTLPANQQFRLRMNQSLDSRRSRVGDRFQTTVLIPVYAGGVEVVPAGSVVEGRVIAVSPARTRGREGQLAVQFDSLVLPDSTKYQMDGVLTQLQDTRAGRVDAESEVSGNSSEKRNVAYIGGGSVGGAVIGGVMGGAKGAGIGAMIGAGAGVAGVMLTKGHEAEVRSGSEIGMATTQPIVFTLRSYR